MELFIAWCGFIGAWLLVAGPIHQAAVELIEEEVDQNAFSEATHATPRAAHVSPWWWLLPPVALLLVRRRSRQHRADLVRALPPEQLQRLVGLMNKANGWLVVAVGAFLISVKETAELLDAAEWNERLLLPAVAVMLVLSLGFTVYRMLASRRVLAQGPARPRNRDGNP